MTFFPDGWVILHIHGEGPDNEQLDNYRVAACWQGGYTTGESYQINSGILRFTKTPTHYTFSGVSGSEYVCSVDTHGKINSILMSVISNLQQNTTKIHITVVPIDQFEQEFQNENPTV